MVISAEFRAETPMVTVLRPLSTSELLDRTFHLYRNNFTVFAGIAGLPQLAVLALQLVFSMLIFAGALRNLAGAMLAGVGAALIIGIASFVAVEVSHAATIMAVSHLHLDRPTSIGLAYASATGRIGRVIGIAFLIGIGVVIGFVLLIVPGVYLALTWSLAIPVTVLEGGGLGSSTKRSGILTKDAKGRIFVIVLLIAVLAWIVSTLVQLVLVGPLKMLNIHDVWTRSALSYALQSAAGFISTCLVGPLATIALTLVYYDQRVRKEGFDLQLMMATIEGGGQGAQIAATAQS
jgi:hypothetical protein